MAGLVVIGFGLNLLMTVTTILSEHVRRLFRSQQQPRRGQAAVRSRPPTFTPTFDSIVDLRGRVRSGRRRSRITFVSVLASAVAGILLMPLGVLVPFFFLFGLITLTVIALRDLRATDTLVGDATGARSSDQAQSSAELRGVGPPLLIGFGRQLPVILGLMIVTSPLTGVDPDHDRIPKMGGFRRSNGSESSDPRHPSLTFLRRIGKWMQRHSVLLP